MTVVSADKLLYHYERSGLFQNIGECDRRIAVTDPISRADISFLRHYPLARGRAVGGGGQHFLGCLSSLSVFQFDQALA